MADPSAPDGPPAEQNFHAPSAACILDVMRSDLTFKRLRQRIMNADVNLQWSSAELLQAASRKVRRGFAMGDEDVVGNLPGLELRDVAHGFSCGDTSEAVSAQCDDEIGDLALDLERMLETVEVTMRRLRSNWRAGHA